MMHCSLAVARLAFWAVALLVGGPAAPARAVPEDCPAVSEWSDSLHTMIDRQNELELIEVRLTRLPTLTLDELADGLQTVATEREAVLAEFQARAVPPSALGVYTAYSLSWEIHAQVADAYIAALRRGDDHQLGIADAYHEASGTIETRARRLLSALLAACEL